MTWHSDGPSSPLTTKGDVYVYGTADDRLPIGTNGQVLTADSAESLGLKWADATGGGGGGSPTGMVLIEEITLVADGVIAFSSIPQDYNDLLIVGQIKGSTAGIQSGEMRVGNGSIDTGTNYDYHRRQAGDTEADTAEQSVSHAEPWVLVGSDAPADEWSPVHLELPGYTGSKYKHYLSFSGAFTSTTTHRHTDGHGRWLSTSAIDELAFYGASLSNLEAGSTLRLYGLGSGAAASGAVPAWMEHLAADGTEDEGQEFTGTIGGTLVEPSGTSTWTQSRGLLSVNFHSQSSGDLAARLYALSGAWAVGSYIETAFRLLAKAEDYSIVTLTVSDGTTAASNIVSASHWIRVSGGPEQISLRSGTITDFALTLENTATNPTTGLLRGLLYARLTYVATDTWRHEISPDGVSWTTLGAGDGTQALTPTHYGVGVSRYGGGAEESVASFEYLRVVL